MPETGEMPNPQEQEEQENSKRVEDSIMEMASPDVDTEALVQQVKGRLRAINESATALTKALGLPPEAKHKVMERMTLGNRSIPTGEGNPPAEPQPKE